MDQDGTDLILGWNVGGTSSSLVVAGSDGRIVEREGWPSGAGRGPSGMIADFLARAREAMAKHGGFAGLGVSIGGPLETLRGVVKSPPHLPGWDEVPLADELRGELGLAVTVEHDAAACLEAEHLWGAARGATHAAYLTCGTGCGAGVLVDGRILRGPRGQSPEAGHIRLAPDGPEGFGKRGSVESFASGDGIARLAPWMFPKRFPGPAGPEVLRSLADGGDEAAKEVLAEAAGRTGQLAAILGDLFALEVIILGSLARYLGETWVEGVRDGFRREGLEVNTSHTRIVPSELGEKLQDLSAVAPVVFARAAGPGRQVPSAGPRHGNGIQQGWTGYTG